MCSRRVGPAIGGSATDGSLWPENGPVFGSEPTGRPRRIKLWDCTDQIHCSVVGTCASLDDLRRIARKVGVAIKPDATDYQIHGHFVFECTSDTPFARAFQRFMDNRHEGAIRRVSRTKGPVALWALWVDMREQGHIAGAYWAFMTHGHVPDDMRGAIFGDVHMLSHLAGASYRRRTVEAVALRDQLQEAEDRARRVEVRLHEALKQRDSEIARLREENARLRATAPAEAGGTEPSRTRGVDKTARQLAKLERALVAARCRARDAEARCKTLECRGPAASAVSGALGAPTPPRPLLPRPGQATMNSRTVLYLGGRSRAIDHFRKIAEEYDARLVHHDGGMEDAVHRIDSILPSVDCVLCPIDCVSHDASQRAKRACKTLGKPFLPLRSASQASFRAALHRVATASGALPDDEPAT